MDSICHESVKKLAEHCVTLDLEAGVSVMLAIQVTKTVVPTRIATADIVAIAHHIQHIIT
jgi:hypothetical protein